MIKEFSMVPITPSEWETQITWFDPEEFDDPDYPGSWKHLHPCIIRRLQFLRNDTGLPIITHNKFGLRGCVCVKPAGHCKNSRHYVDHPEEPSAVDFHFVTDQPPGWQIQKVISYGFMGVGIYYDWSWKGLHLKVGFHVENRPDFKVWKRINGIYQTVIP